LEKLADKETFKQKYNVDDDLKVLLFAMGDGNHSFATAKAIWEEKKKSLTEAEQATHPARFALVEINNVHDAGITFEPIHRVLFNIDAQDLLKEMSNHFSRVGSTLEIQYFDTKEEIKAELPISNDETQYLWGVHKEGYFLLTLHDPKLNLEVGNIQQFLDLYLKDHTDASIDYVHGEDITEELGKKANNIGFLFPVMDKSDFFKTVIKD
jgi:hypothetical protein